MPSTDRKLELKAKDIDGSDRLTAGCVLTDLASLAVSRTAVYANGLTLCPDSWRERPHSIYTPRGRKVSTKTYATSL
jgi:hypothetical protein